MPKNAHRKTYSEKTIENIHPNAPKRLVSLWRKLGSDRQVGYERDVNHFYVSQLLWRGIEPPDLTEHQQEIRARLFLPRKKRKPRVPRPPKLPKWLKQADEAIEWFMKQQERVKTMAKKTRPSVAKLRRETNRKK